ncbi:hypothetical protein BCO26_1035 [Heyndrickxia coagulans 2-6]|nr:hypothetical protein BCO26_1035 [Heyndrickxia coagulans 2-6]
MNQEKICAMPALAKSRTKKATIGEISIMPIGGMILRKGSR